MKPQLIFQLTLLLTAIMISINCNIQTKKNQLLDIYKVDFDYYVKSIDTNIVSETPMYAEMKGMDKAGQTLLQVYAHSEYLYAKHSWISNQDAEVWLVKYKTGKLFQLLKKEALSMDFEYRMRTNVLLPNEGFPERWKAHGNILLTNDTMTVAGYLCKRAVIDYTPDIPKKPGDKKLERTVWYCPELPKFYFPSFEYLQKIPGMALLIYEDRGHDLIEGYKALNVVKQKKPLSFFEVPKGTKILYEAKK